MKLQKLIDSLKQSTGLAIDVYALSGQPLTNDAPALDTVPDLNLFIDGVYCDTQGGRTFFVTDNRLGVIDGTDRTCHNYALLISRIIESALIPVELDRNERLRLYFTGQLNSLQIAALKSTFLQKCNYFVINLVCKSSKYGELQHFMSTICSKDDMLVPVSDTVLVYIKHCDESDEYQSASDFAHVLDENIHEEMKIDLKICVGGTAHSFEDLLNYYEHARLSYDFGQLIDKSNNIYSFKEYVLIKMLSDIDSVRLKQYLNTVMDESYRELVKDKELMETADVFMKNSLNISETSRCMYMHRNTLIYRLDKIEKATGLNIRYFNDAMTFRIVSIILKLEK